MFSFRTTPIMDQTDRALVNGPVGVFCTPSCWHADTGLYLPDMFRERGVLRRTWKPEGDHILFDMEDFQGLAAVVVEIQDTGSRYFPYTVDVLRLMTAMRALPEPPALYIVDHPNPAGREVEGTIPAGVADEWTPAVAHRHGLTLGELCYLYADEIKVAYPLHVISAAVADTARTLMPWTIPPAHDFPGVFTPYFYSGGRRYLQRTVVPRLPVHPHPGHPLSLTVAHYPADALALQPLLTLPYGRRTLHQGGGSGNCGVPERRAYLRYRAGTRKGRRAEVDT